MVQPWRWCITWCERRSPETKLFSIRTLSSSGIRPFCFPLKRRQRWMDTFSDSTVLDLIKSHRHWGLFGNSPLDPSFCCRFKGSKCHVCLLCARRLVTWWGHSITWLLECSYESKGFFSHLIMMSFSSFFFWQRCLFLLKILYKTSWKFVILVFLFKV